MYQLVNADQTGLINNMKSKGLKREIRLLKNIILLQKVPLEAE